MADIVARIEGEGSTGENLAERVKELECLYGISRILHRADASIEEMLQEIAAFLPRGFKHPGHAASRISAAGHVCQTPAFIESRFRLSAAIASGGSVEVSYPPEMTGMDPVPFLPEELKLMEKAAADISEAVERARAAEERARLEAQLRHADRLATVGVMAAGVAHELNEPLATILGFAQLVGKSESLPAQVVRDTAQIVEACLRAREIVRGLLIFGGSAPAKTEDCDLGRIVREGIRFLEPRCKSEGISLALHLDPGVPVVRGDPAQLTHVLVNLVVNSVQAMPTGGALTVTTRADLGDAALLVVQDTGIGMSADTMDRIFVPFFTTKGTGRGTGLGLAVVHGIVASLGGTIGVQSEVGKGARFEVRLPGPAAGARVSRAAAAGPNPTPVAVPVRILVVDDAPGTVEVLQRNLSSRGYEVRTASSAMEAIRVLEVSEVDLVITDYRMPGVDGRELARHIVENHHDVEVVMITGFGSIENAVSAMKAGVAEYLTKPFTDEELFTAVHAALQKLDLRRAGRGAARALPRAPQGLVGESRAMREVFRLIEKAAPVSAPVLITGESGTGKEMAARAIHYGGPRSAAPFVPVNCSAIPEGLIESELFGYVKGAFTGADQSRAGYFQTAEGGTLFLDEIAETSPSMQAKLLRALQDGEIAMVGSPRAHRVDVRVVAASNKDLMALVARGRFREDLFYRLNVISLAIPPLRDRDDDLLLLLRHFAERYAAEYGKEPLRFTPHALAALRRHAWPGNVRELSNAIQRIALMHESGPVDAPDLPSLMRFTAFRGPGVPRTLGEVEAAHIAEVLASVKGNRSRAAEILGIDRKTLAARLKRGGGEKASTGEELPS